MFEIFLQVISLLKKWPEMKSKLHVCFNQPLAPPIRQLAWKLFLANPKGTFVRLRVNPDLCQPFDSINNEVKEVK